MTDLLKGNFTPRNAPKLEPVASETLEDRFEREALKRLGGSIAFVSKKRVDWGAADPVKPTPKE
jgi:hypothetical protein